MCDIECIASGNECSVNNRFLNMVFAEELILEHLHEDVGELTHSFSSEVVAFHERFTGELMFGVFVACSLCYRCLNIKNQTVFMPLSD